MYSRWISEWLHLNLNSQELVCCFIRCLQSLVTFKPQRIFFILYAFLRRLILDSLHSSSSFYKIVRQMVAALYFLKIRHFWKTNIASKPPFFKEMDRLKNQLLYTISLTLGKKSSVFLLFFYNFWKKEKLLEQQKLLKKALTVLTVLIKVSFIYWTRQIDLL